MKMVKMFGACCWGVGCVTIVENGENGWGLWLGCGARVPLCQRNIENSLDLCLEYGLCTTSENCENNLGLGLECRLGTSR